ncbi:Ammonium transporter, partial [uncultured Gammaproteobacteria bacterium]
WLWVFVFQSKKKQKVWIFQSVDCMPIQNLQLS